MRFPSELFERLATSIETQGRLAAEYLDAAAHSAGIDVRAQSSGSSPLVGRVLSQEAPDPFFVVVEVELSERQTLVDPLF